MEVLIIIENNDETIFQNSFASFKLLRIFLFTILTFILIMIKP